MQENNKDKCSPQWFEIKPGDYITVLQGLWDFTQYTYDQYVKCSGLDKEQTSVDNSFLIDLNDPRSVNIMSIEREMPYRGLVQIFKRSGWELYNNTQFPQLDYVV